MSNTIDLKSVIMQLKIIIRDLESLYEFQQLDFPNSASKESEDGSDPFDE